MSNYNIITEQCIHLQIFTWVNDISFREQVSKNLSNIIIKRTLMDNDVEGIILNLYTHRTWEPSCSSVSVCIRNFKINDLFKTKHIKFTRTKWNWDVKCQIRLCIVRCWCSRLTVQFLGSLPSQRCGYGKGMHDERRLGP